MIISSAKIMKKDRSALYIEVNNLKKNRYKLVKKIYINV